MKARFLLLGSALLLGGCGWSLESARETAAVKACDSYNRCMQLGSGKTYESYDACLTKQRAYWLDAWPTATCDGHLNSASIDACLKAIDNTSCNSLIDFLATLDKCDKKNTCAP
ncbi:MAG: DUF6184 family natural product biosynthesis lipoprotein [Myxococcota bacterium]|jgi:hypothetical protein